MATAAAVAALTAATIAGDIEITTAIASITAEMVAEYAATQSEELIAAAAISALLGAYIAIAYTDLAQKYYDMYDAQRQFYYNNFQNNTSGESGLLTQVFVNPLAGNGQSGTSYTPQYLAQAANIAGFDTQGAFSSDWWQFHANMYNDAPFSAANNPRGYSIAGIGEPEALDKAATIADYDTYLFRYEEHRKDVYDERTWEWQNQALNFGIKQANVVESGLATSFKFLDESMGNMSDWFATQSNGLAKYAGYRSSYNRSAEELAASTQQGRALSISTSLGADRPSVRRVPDVYDNNVSRRITQGYMEGTA